MMREPRPYLPVGTRVRHWGQRYSRALFEGTGVIGLIAGPYYDGTWEYLIYQDEGAWAPGQVPPPTWWPSYGTEAMEHPRCWPECILACSPSEGRGICRYRPHEHEQQEARAS